MGNLNTRLLDMQVHFQNMDLELDNIQKLEEQQLNTLFAENSAATTFNHEEMESVRDRLESVRNYLSSEIDGLSKQIDTATTRLSSEIVRNREVTRSMANIQMDVFKSEADNSVSHYDNVIDKFQNEVERYKARSDAAAQTIKILNSRFKESLKTLEDEGDKFKI